MTENSTAYIEAEINAQVCRFPIFEGKICSIGRADKNTIVLDDDLASRNHAMLHVSGSKVYLTDCGSRNGTLVNGRRIAVPVTLRPGDRITIGSHEFTFHQTEENAPEPAPIDMKATSFHLASMLITVLVVDIRDFTGLARRLSSDRLGEIASTLFRGAGQVLEERGAWAQKYIGDAVMAVWLHANRHADIRDFIRIFEALAKLVDIATGLQDEFGLDTPIRIGAGINTGLAAIGNFGSIASSDYTALGDVVNKAFRLESSTKEMQRDLALGESTYEALLKAAEIADFFQGSMMHLKGYDEPALVYGGELSSIDALIDVLKNPRATGETKDDTVHL
jgi:adenylate cyclase